MSPSSTHREVERKVRVPGLFELPELDQLPGVWSVEAQPIRLMRAVYHDTEHLNLFRWGITLRRREGGPDEGWHMKLPVAGRDGQARDEMHQPLSAGTVGSVPPAFVHVVAPLLRDQSLTPIVVMETERTPYFLLDAEGIVRAELVDDHVVITRDGRILSAFREIEVEATDGDDPACLAILDSAVDALIALGGEASSVSKVANALGMKARQQPDVPELPLPGPTGLAVDALRAIMAKHVRHLLLADVAVRRELPDSVHQMRVAARRLRSTMTTFRSLLDDERAVPLREELKWLASELGAIRDTEVLMERLDEHAQHLPAEDAERASIAVDEHLNRRMEAARSSAIAALRSDRHQDLIEDLITAVAQPPVNDDAYQPCAQALPPLMRKTWRRLDRDVAGLDLDSPSVEWHEARIHAKRARYAAEALEGILGGEIPRLADDLADVTELLGTHQDAHVAQTTIRHIATTCDGATGFSLGLLHEYEAEEEILDRVRFTKIWARAQRSAARAGLA